MIFQYAHQIPLFLTFIEIIRPVRFYIVFQYLDMRNYMENCNEVKYIECHNNRYSSRAQVYTQRVYYYVVPQIVFIIQWRPKINIVLEFHGLVHDFLEMFHVVQGGFQHPR